MTENHTASAPGLSPWLRETLADVMRDPAVQAHLDHWKPGPPGMSMMIDLGDGTPGSREDLTCDKCRTFCPDGLNISAHPLFSPAAADLPPLAALRWTEIMQWAPVIVTIGLCDRCDRKEAAR